MSIILGFVTGLFVIGGAVTFGFSHALPLWAAALIGGLAGLLVSSFIALVRLNAAASEVLLPFVQLADELLNGKRR